MTLFLSRRKLLLNAIKLGAAISASRAFATALPKIPIPFCTPGGLRKTSLRLPQPAVVPMLHPDTLPKFVDRLPIPQSARSERLQTDSEHPGKKLPYYRVAMREAETQIHRDLPPTRVWSYGNTMPGPTFDVRSHQPILVEWANELPSHHFLPIDHNLHGAGKEFPEVRTVVHVHGARVPPESDGYPEHWFVPGQNALYRYPNNQDATTLWYHDHTMGIERLNQYAGLFGMYLIRDDAEDALNLPSGEFEVPLMLSDRLLSQDGQLHYPVSGILDAPWISEMYGDAVLINGKLFPYLEVEPRPYRFRIVNASNARFYYLALSNDAPLVQIGSDQGLLAHSVALKRITLAPAERADVIIDFSKLPGQQCVLQSQAMQLMQFRVKAHASSVAAIVPAALRPVAKLPRSAARKVRTLTLDEYEDPDSHMMMMLLNGTYWRMPVTETAELDSIEIWNLVNPTEDTHPIHLHLVRFQIMERQKFDADEFLLSGKTIFVGAPIPPEPGEAGWKDTVQAHPGLITRIIMRFEGYPGRYVWHCHVLEHAANEMMRPFEVVAPQAHKTG